MICNLNDHSSIIKIVVIVIYYMPLAPLNEQPRDFSPQSPSSHRLPSTSSESAALLPRDSADDDPRAFAMDLDDPEVRMSVLLFRVS